ncbi:hypothetical protein EYC80_001453 [Monilinia laxa]|uniref:J domain-containing protein n=1 Tax=Monilinia laxa TaxID=61186 RepID=A0A5N6K4V7_MONLA|nr:hypothetical protein EYC80_001453 [Monilinia laxa]
MSDIDLYAALKVAPSASLGQIKHAYRHLTSKEDPENKYDDPNIKLAYETLSCPIKRQEYDEKHYYLAEGTKYGPELKNLYERTFKKRFKAPCRKFKDCQGKPCDESLKLRFKEYFKASNQARYKGRIAVSQNPRLETSLNKKSNGLRSRMFGIEPQSPGSVDTVTLATTYMNDKLMADKMDNKSEGSNVSKRQSSESESADVPRHQLNSSWQTPPISENANDSCGELRHNSPPRSASHESSISGAIGSTETRYQLESIPNTKNSNTEEQHPIEEQRLSPAPTYQHIENRKKGKGKANKRSSDSLSDSDQSLKRQKFTPEPVDSEKLLPASVLNSIIESSGMEPRIESIPIRSLDGVIKNHMPPSTQSIPSSSHDFRAAHPSRPKSKIPLPKSKCSVLNTDVPEDAPAAPLGNIVLDNVSLASNLAQNACVVTPLSPLSPEKESRKYGPRARKSSIDLVGPVRSVSIQKFRVQRKRESRGEFKKVCMATELDTVSRSINGLRQGIRQGRHNKGGQQNVQAENDQKKSYCTFGENSETKAMAMDGNCKEFTLNPGEKSLKIPDYSRSYNSSLTVGMATNPPVDDETRMADNAAFFAALPIMRRNYPEFAPVFTDSEELSLNGGGSGMSTDSGLPELVIDAGTSEDDTGSGFQPSTPIDAGTQELNSHAGITGGNTGTGGLRTRPPSIPADGNVLQSFLDPAVSPGYDASNESSAGSYSSSTRDQYFPNFALAPMDAGIESNTEQEQREPDAVDVSHPPQDDRIEQIPEGPASEIGNPMIGTNYQRVRTDSPASGSGVETSRAQGHLVAPWHVEGDRLTPNVQVNDDHGRSYEFETMHIPENDSSRDQSQRDERHEGVVRPAPRSSPDLIGGESSMERRRTDGVTLLDQEWRPDEYELEPQSMGNLIPGQYDGVAGGIERIVPRWSWESEEHVLQESARHRVEHEVPMQHDDNIHYVEHVERTGGEQSELNRRSNEHEPRNTNTDAMSPSQYQEMAGETGTRRRTAVKRVVAFADRLKGRREEPTPQESNMTRIEPMQREGGGEQSEVNRRTDGSQREADSRRPKRSSNIRDRREVRKSLTRDRTPVNFVNQQDNASRNTSRGSYNDLCCPGQFLYRRTNGRCNVMVTTRLPSPPRGLEVWVDDVSNRKTLEMLGFLPDEDEINIGKESYNVGATRPRFTKDEVVNYLQETSPKSIHLCLNGKKRSSQVDENSEDYAIVREIAGSSDRYWVFDIEDIHCPTCCKIIRDQNRREANKATRLHSRARGSTRHQHCINSHCHQICDHERRPHHVLSRLGLGTSHKIKYVQLISSSPYLDPDVLASAITVLRPFFGQLNGLELVLATEKTVFPVEYQATYPEAGCSTVCLLFCGIGGVLFEARGEVEDQGIGEFWGVGGDVVGC